MPDVNFQQIIDNLKNGVINLALSSFKQYTNEAKTDALQLLEDMKVSLEKWTIQLAKGELSKADFEFLVLGQKDLLEMNALKQAGLALIEADQFKTNLLNLISNTIMGSI